MIHVYILLNTQICKILNDVTDNVYTDIFVRSSHNISLEYLQDLIVPFTNSVLIWKDSLIKILWVCSMEFSSNCNKKFCMSACFASQKQKSGIQTIAPVRNT